MKLLEKALKDRSFLLELRAGDFESILHQALNHVVAQGGLAAEHRDEVEQLLLTREEQASTVIGHSVAVPHAYIDHFAEPVIVFVRLQKPLNLGAPDGIPTRYIFVLLGPTGRAAEHLDTLMNVARLMSDDEFRYDIGWARNQDELLDSLGRFIERTAPPAAPREAEAPDGLRYTGKLFGGLIGDVRRRLPHYADDFRDGLHVKSVASTLFLYFACLAPAVTFGGLLAIATENQIGAVEMILATAICGIAYALFAGQPLIILGGTGPLLLFEIVLYNLCGQMELPYLETRAWVGLWTAGLLLLLAATDASCLVRYFTRFTDEIFAALISIIFITSALEALGEIFFDVYGEESPGHDEALVPLILALGTFYIAMNLSAFRRSRYLFPWMREFLADFGPAIAIGAMTAVAFWFSDVPMKQLAAPDTFSPTTPRSWLLDLGRPPSWVWIAALAPASLVAVLAFIDQNITARLVNSREHKLHRGEAYHLDLAGIGLLVGVCSVLGLPWLVAATVRSLNHVRSLATMDEVVTAGGDTHERVIHVQENRVTPLAIHILIGVSLMLLPLLKTIPMAVLYGLFLFMGIVSIAGNQLFERMSLWIMDSALYPKAHYIRQVPIWTIHQFTFIQVACLAMLWVVEVSPAAILFPLFIVLLVPVRFALGRFFDPKHLEALDAEEEPEQEETRRVD